MLFIQEIKLNLFKNRCTIKRIAETNAIYEILEITIKDDSISKRLI